MVPSCVTVFSLRGSGIDGSLGRPLREAVRVRSSELSTIEFSLRRDGMAGVCGEIGFPGDDDDGEADAGAIMPGTLVNCRLDELDDLCNCMDEVMDSVRAWFDSFIMWNLDSCATVLFVDASPRFAVSKLLSVRLLSKIFKNSDMLSSSAGSEPELVASGSAKRPDPGCATEDARLCLPLLFCSSSPPLPMPLNDGRLRRCVKLLLYRLADDGLGEPTGISVG